MNGRTAKRFWTLAVVVQSLDGFSIQLDGRPVHTPAKALLTVPTKGMADAIAAEWQAQGAAIDPTTMPVTKSANAAIDKVTPQFAEVSDMLAAYGDSDLTCYRAGAPQALVDRQSAAWDPLLDWAAQRFGALLIPVEGVVHRPQNPACLTRLRAPLEQMTPFELTAMHDLVSLSGSLVIALAVAEAHQSVETAWKTSRIDEDWQIEQWGEDNEATAQANQNRAAFAAAARFLDLAHRKAGPAKG